MSNDKGPLTVSVIVNAVTVRRKRMSLPRYLGFGSDVLMDRSTSTGPNIY